MTIHSRAGDRPPSSRALDADVAFVLGGGGALGACEVGMLRALTEADVRPGIVLGTSVGAINGALFAASPTRAGADRLDELWRADDAGVFGASLLRQVSTLARSRTHVHNIEPLRRRLERTLAPAARFEQLALPFQCVAASIERAAEHWFDHGPIAEAVLASSAVPGILPPVQIGEEHFIDGGIVNSIPVGRAVALGARTIYVLQVGRLERPLHPPRWPWEVGLVAFEVARRHRFQFDMANLPRGVTVHMLPTGGTAAPAFNDLAGQLRHRHLSPVAEQIAGAYDASLAYLAENEV